MLSRLTRPCIVVAALGTCFSPVVAQSPAERLSARKLFAEAFEQAKRQDTDTAIGLLKKGLDLDPSDYRAHALLGQLLESKGSGDDAVAAYKSVLRTAPSNSIELVKAQARLAKLIEPDLPDVVQAPSYPPGFWYSIKSTVLGRETNETYSLKGETASGYEFISTIKEFPDSRYLIKYDRNLSVLQSTAADGSIQTNSWIGQSIDFPLKVGKRWTSESTNTFVSQYGTDVTVRSEQAEVVRADKIDTVAGKTNVLVVKFNATVKITSAGKTNIFEGSGTRYYAPRFGIIVKSEGSSSNAVLTDIQAPRN